jgi:hypothetical protein
MIGPALQKRGAFFVFSFENEEIIFLALHHVMKFCLMTMRAQGANPTHLLINALRCRNGLHPGAQRA